MNTYAYVSADPLGSIDAEGLFEQSGNFRYIPGLSTPDVPVRRILPSGPGLVGLAIVGGAATGVAIYLSSKVEDPNATVPIGSPSASSPNGTAQSCPIDENCKRTHDRLLADYNRIVRVAAAGFNVKYAKVKYQREAKLHNALCFPRWQVPTIFPGES